MASSNPLRNLSALADRLFLVAVATCLVVAPLSAACCPGTHCEAGNAAANSEKLCHESMRTSSNSDSIAARATRGCDSMNSSMEAIREEFRVSNSGETHANVRLTDALARDSLFHKQINEPQFPLQSLLNLSLVLPFSSAIFPLRT
jgi:hypothetical protein